MLLLLLLLLLLLDQTHRETSCCHPSPMLVKAPQAVNSLLLLLSVPVVPHLLTLSSSH